MWDSSQLLFVTSLILVNEVLIPDKYIKSVLFLEELGKENYFQQEWDVFVRLIPWPRKK